jgi:hypothetical protein
MSAFLPRPPHVDLRRAVHFKILPETHSALRIFCISKGISMQEFFEEIAQCAISTDPRISKIVDELVKDKRERYYRQLSTTDAESIYNLLEFESPLSK